MCRDHYKKDQKVEKEEEDNDVVLFENMHITYTF